jgi:hypothetical protein
MQQQGEITLRKAFLTRREASQYSGFSMDTLAKWAVTGRGPRFSKIGTSQTSRVRYAVADLDAFLRGETPPERSAIPPSPEPGGHSRRAPKRATSIGNSRPAA